MSSKTHPFKYIQIVEDLCAIIEETPLATSFDWIEDVDMNGDDWDAVIYYLPMMIQHLQEIAVEPLSQLCLLQMIESVHTQPDINWDCIGNMDRAAYLAYRDGFIFFASMDDYLFDNYSILVVEF